MLNVRATFGLCFLFGLSSSANAAHAAHDGDELFLIAANRALISELFQMPPIAESRSIQEYVQGTLMQGTALTQGTASASFYPSQNGVGLALNLQTFTNAYTLNRNVPRPDIAINFDWTINTSANTTKYILLRETGFALYPAQTFATSSITVHGLQASASGLFWRLKSRIADRKAWEQLEETRASNERQAANKIASELNSLVDQRAWDQLLPIHNLYYQYVYEPFVPHGMLGGRLGMGSNADWLAVVGTYGSELHAIDAATVPGLTSAAASDPGFLCRLHDSLLERMINLRLGGIEITEIELAQALQTIPDDPPSVEDVLGSSKELDMVFDDEPVKLSFDTDVVHATLQIRQLTTLGKVYQSIAIPVEISVTAKDSQVKLKLVARDAMSYGGTVLDKALVEHIRDRLGRSLLPKHGIKISEKVLLPTVKPISVRALTIGNGSLTVNLVPLHGAVGVSR